MASFSPNISPLSPTPQECSDYQTKGYTSFDQCLSPKYVESLNFQLEKILRGDFESGVAPDKVPKRVKSPLPSRPPTTTTSSATRLSSAALGFSGNHQGIKVLQTINNWKSSPPFEQLVRSPLIAAAVAKLAGWEDVGVRLAQDQAWLKPPSAPSLNFHRDTPYFMFDSPSSSKELRESKVSDVVTVWFALDEMDDELGPLEYCDGSHLWVGGRTGAMSQFFSEGKKADPDSNKDLLFAAAKEQGFDDPKTSLTFTSMTGLPAGGFSIHNGLTFHGSGPNQSKSKPRRGLGIHYVRGDIKWDVPRARFSKLWRAFVDKDVERTGWKEGDEGGCDVDLGAFPFVLRGNEEKKQAAATPVLDFQQLAANVAKNMILQQNDDASIARRQEMQVSIQAEKPNIKDALKNYLSLRMAVISTVPPSGGRGQPVNAVSDAVKSWSFDARRFLKLVNDELAVSDLVSTDDSHLAERDGIVVKLFEKVKGMKAGGVVAAKPADLFGKSLLQLKGVKEAILKATEGGESDNEAEDGVDGEGDEKREPSFLAGFLATVEENDTDEDGAIVWCRDGFKEGLAKRQESRKCRAAERLALEETGDGVIDAGGVEYL
jgi:ectoine hydroxylase-related dioxygenase (phytanoyl-CoA dioxygenase family)